MTELTQLKYCPRTKHSDGMPLKKPRKNCHCKSSSWIRRYPKTWDRRNPDECIFYPMHLQYMEANHISLDGNFGIRFRCVVDAQGRVSHGSDRYPVFKYGA